jgi:hypothetical protein
MGGRKNRKRARPQKSKSNRTGKHRSHIPSGDQYRFVDRKIGHGPSLTERHGRKNVQSDSQEEA